MTTNRWLLSALAVLTLLFAAACSSSSGTTAEDDVPEYDYVIPAGYAAALEAGDAPVIIPAELDVRVGESIRVVNNDSVDHLIGPFFVGAGETLRQNFPNEGRFEGVCTTHEDGSFVLNVTA